MRYFLDTEFYEEPSQIDLISIGIVAEDGREYYAENKDADFYTIEKDLWLRDNVLKNLDGGYVLVEFDNDIIIDFDGESWRTRAEIKSDLLAFLNPKPTEFWGYYADYDWVAFCWLFGRMADLPEGYPMFCHDLKQVSEVNFHKLPAPTLEHNALADARWNCNVYNFIK